MVCQLFISKLNRSLQKKLYQVYGVLSRPSSITCTDSCIKGCLLVIKQTRNCSPFSNFLSFLIFNKGNAAFPHFQDTSFAHTQIIVDESNSESQLQKQLDQSNKSQQNRLHNVKPCSFCATILYSNTTH